MQMDGVDLGGFVPLNDLDYFRRRAFEERQRAAAAGSPEAASIHQELARHYENLIASADKLPLTQAATANDELPLI